MAFSEVYRWDCLFRLEALAVVAGLRALLAQRVVSLNRGLTP